MPEHQGVSSAALLALVDALVGLPELHSLMVVRRGHVVAEGWAAPFSSDRPHLLYSLSKSFTSTAIGLACAEGLLTLDDLVLDHFADVAPAEPDDRLRALRVGHLLTMTGGHGTDPSDAVLESDDWARTFLATPLEHDPGTTFVYSTSSTYMLSELLQRRTGRRVTEFLAPRLLEPLGIEGMTAERSPAGIEVGGSGMSATTEDIALLGELYLRDGVLDGVRLLPEGWVAQATSAQVSTGRDPSSDWGRGYGYQFWRCRHDAFRGDGAFGQFCVVVPALELVVVLTSGRSAMHDQLDAVWEHLLPGVAPDELPADPAGHAALVDRLGSLRLDPPASVAAVPSLDGRTLTLETNPIGLTSVRVRQLTGSDELTLTFVDRTEVLVAGHDVPARNLVRVTRTYAEEALLTGAWTGDGEYTLFARFVGGPQTLTLRARLDGTEVQVSGAFNVSFGPLDTLALRGSLV